MIWFNVAVVEDGGRGQEPRNVGNLQEMEKSREWAHLEPPGGNEVP